MTVRNPPSWLQAGSHPAEQDRLALQSLLGAAGICNLTDLGVAQHSTPNMSVDVASGACFVDGTESANQGFYHVYNDALLVVNIAAADPTNPRIDLIVAKVQDAAYSGAINTASIVAVTGTAAASPAAPAAPANSLVLAQIAVAAGATTITNANITDKRTPSGMILPVATAVSLYPTARRGLGVYRASGDANEGPEYYNGASYGKPWNMPWGEVPGGFAAMTGSQTGISGAVDLTNLSVTVTMLANRKYRTTLYVPHISQVTTNGTQIFFITNATPTTVNQARQAATAGLSSSPMTVIHRETGVPGSVNRRGRASTSAGTMDITWAANDYGFILVEDIGPAGAPQ